MRSWGRANGSGVWGCFFVRFNGAKYSKSTVEVGKSIYLTVIRYSAESFGAGSKARITKFCA